MTQTIRTIRIATQGPAGPAGLYPHASWSAGSVPYARSSVLAHNGGVWLALRDTSVEPSGSVPDNWASWLDFSGMTSGFATLDGTGKIPAAQLPAIAITDAFVVASQAAMLALTAQKGDIAIRSDLNRSFVLAADDPSVLANWRELLTPTDAVLSVAGRTGAVTLSAGDVSGLAPSATTDATDAGNIASGTLSNARLSGVALTANNLSDLGNVGTARSNLGLGAVATLNVGSGLASGGGNLSANVTSVAGRTGAVTLAQADVSGLTTADAPTFANATLAAGTITTSQPHTITQTWNASGVTFKSLLVNVTDTASASGSLLMDLQVGGVSKAKVDKSGGLTIGGSLYASSGILNGLAAQVGLVTLGGGAGAINQNSPAAGVLNVDTYTPGSFSRLTLGGTTSSFPAIKRDGAGIAFRLADDSAGTWAKVGSYTVAGAPSASTAGAGAIIFVSNENGGATLAFSDGTNWKRTKDLATIS